MSKTETVTLTGAYTHHEDLGDGREHARSFAAGAHTLPTEIAHAARAAGLVAESEAAAQPAVKAPAAKARARKPRAAKA